MSVQGQDFSDLVRRLADGAVDTEASEELALLLREVRSQAEQTNSVVSGTIKLTLRLKCNPKGMLDINHEIDAKRPKKVTLPTTVWATKQGGVSFDMPRQERLPMIDVGGPRRVIVDIDDNEKQGRN